MEPLPPLHTLPQEVFFRRLFRNILIGVLLITLSLGLGMIGYRYFENMSWVDSYVNAAMILSGMGPVSTLNTDGGKIFAGSYALFSGIFFLFVMAIVFAPVVRLFLHKFHMQEGKK